MKDNISWGDSMANKHERSSVLCSVNLQTKSHYDRCRYGKECLEEDKELFPISGKGIS